MVLLFKNVSILNRDIKAKLPSHKSRSVGQSVWYEIADDSKLEGDNIKFSVILRYTNRVAWHIFLINKLVWEKIDYFSISSCSIHDKLLDYSFIFST